MNLISVTGKWVWVLRRGSGSGEKERKEHGGKEGDLYTSGEFPLPSQTESADFYRMASSTLSDAGYNHYEIMLVD
ncbi:hypothetical protein FH972_009975 [Carpinus fangiana]|uniref:Uncharacterized protein n=1 Tax=Carpinus fangiana TaxID=176857 RepID=A0A660KTV2_9ROSI|nr:hypothetical protein FH972_009975 [Carpinus fangiana]